VRTPWRYGKLLGFTLLACCACSTLRTSYVKPYSAAFAAPAGAPTTEYAQAKVNDHDGRSGFRLLVDNNDALMSRVVLADKATRSIDLQYYIYDDDATGRLVSQRLLAAADRGVRVRLLVDDLDAGDAEQTLDGLDAHPNIEVRLFNPFHTRNPSLLSRIGQFLIDGPRLNRRMHNKSFVVDNSVAILGGRNIGDAYFKEGDTQHFRDLDVIAIGPVVEQTSHAFDTYWNATPAYPVKAFDSSKDGGEALAKLRQKLAGTARATSDSAYASSLGAALPGGAAVDKPGQWMWGRASIVADQPQKVEGKDDPALLLDPKLDSMIGGAQHDVMLISAYFVPGDEDTKLFTALARRGVHVKVLTNSLAATDEPMVHAGYARYRRDLLKGGVDVYELRPLVGNQPAAHGASSGVSLHAKAVVVDRKRVFIGSMNIDERSKLLNTEMGVIADSPDLAAATAEYFNSATKPINAYHVTIDDGTMHWTALGDDGKMKIEAHEPDVPLARRLEVYTLRVLPIDGLL